MTPKTRILLISCLILFSCNKEKLNDEGSFLIGTWNWTHSDRTTGWCDNNAWSETITPISYSSEFKVVFTSKNKVGFYENDVLLNEYRAKFTTLENQDTSDIYFQMSLGNDANKFTGSGSISELRFSRFPFKEEEGCGSYINYFVKE